MSNGYLWVKLIHVVAVTVWFGGTVMVTVMFSRFSTDDSAVNILSRLVEWIGKSVFMPSAIITLLSGIGLMLMLHAHPPIWMIWGLIAAPLTSIIGAVFLRKAVEELAAVVASGGEVSRANAAKARIRSLQTTILLVLLSTVAMMVLKPF